MSLINQIGIAGGFQANKVWSIVSLDDPTVKFQGQFHAENLTENVGVDLGTQGALGSQEKSRHFLGGIDESITFRARLFRTSPVKGAVFDALSNPVGTAFDLLTGNADELVGSGSVRDEVEKLKSFARAIDRNGKPWPMGRPHIFNFVAGTELEFTVFLSSVGGIIYDELRSDGTIRGATFQITMQKVRPENLTLSRDAGVSTAGILKTALGVVTSVAGGLGLGTVPRANLINIPGGSLHTTGRKVKVKTGMTFESIARTEYGNPLLGDILRRAQPDKADLQTGDDVILVKREEIVQIPITPQSISLRDRTENKALLDFYLERRGQPKAVVI